MLHHLSLRCASLILVLSFLLFQQTLKAGLDNSSISQNEQSECKLKILVLVIASDQNYLYPSSLYKNNIENNPIYPELQKLWKTYMKSDPQHVEVYFLKSDPNLKDDIEVQADTIWYKGEETWIPGILNKTIVSIEAMLPRLREFQYIIRTNLSSFYVFPRLLKYLETLPREKCYCGMRCDYGGYPFVQAAGIILSPDLAKLLVDNKAELINHSIIDDALLGIFFYNQHVDMIDVLPGRFDITSLED